jgi:hypothetical protein
LRDINRGDFPRTSSRLNLTLANGDVRALPRSRGIRTTGCRPAVIGACKGQEKGKAMQLCSETHSKTGRNAPHFKLSAENAPPAAAGTRGGEIGARKELSAWEIWLAALDSNQEPSG